MKKTDVEARLQAAVAHATPDVLEDILSRCQQKGNVVQMKPKNKAKGLIMALAAAAAALAITVGAALMLRGPSDNAVDSVIAIDVNPSVELAVNKEETVLSATALNSDGNTILDNMDLEGTQLDVAMNALIGSMVKNGYISELQNSVLITVANDDPQKSQELEQRLSSEVQSILDASAISGAVLTQTATSDDAINALAEQYGMSTGKAMLITTIIAQNPIHTVEELAGLTINDLNLIASGSQLNGVVQSGSASQGSYIGQEKAYENAMAYWQLTDAQRVKAELDYENGRMVYEVKLISGNYEYECDVDALTGQITDFGMEQINGSQSLPSASGSSGSMISAEEAKQIAFSHSGVTNPSYVEIDFDDGYYEIEFRANGYEYDYDVNAYTGAVAKSQKEIDDDYPNAASTAPSGSTGAVMTVDSAKQAALAHSGVTNPTQLEVEMDDGYFEVEFKANGYEYDYKINAYTGEIVKSEKEVDDDYRGAATAPSTTAPSASSGITAEEAKQIALSHSGVSNATVTKVERDGRYYEIEFKANGYEYDYEVNATTGEVVKSQKEVDDDYHSSTSVTVTAEQAKQAALSHSGVSNPTQIKVELDDGYYDVEFKANGYEYDYKVSASTGKVVSYERDRD